MKPNLEYTAKILAFFEESDFPDVAMVELWKDNVIENDSRQFVFHYKLMIENGLVSRSDLVCNSLESLGLGRNEDGEYQPLNYELRLTQSGHDFAKALANKKVLEKIKSDFSEAPFKTIYEESLKLLTKYTFKKIEELHENAP